jgi:RHS repeat-associated protein
MSIVTITSGNRTEITKYKYGTDGIRVSAEHEVWEDNELKSKTKTEYLNDLLNITGYSQVLKQTETNFVSEEETVTTYVIGHQRISQIVVKNGTEQEYYFTFDGHGSTRVLLDFAGAIAQLYAFNAYGNAIGFDPSVALTEFLYSGEQFDSKIGQQYLRQRYYDPATGRFNRLDPFFGHLNDPQSLHKYLYTHNDPVNGIDPSGLEFSVSGMMTSVGLQNMIRVGTGFLQTAFRVYKIVEYANKIIQYTQSVNQLIQFAKTMWDGMNGGIPITTTFINALNQVFNFNNGMQNMQELLSRLGEVAENVGQERLKTIFHDILTNSHIIAAKVAANENMIEIVKAALTRENLVVVFAFPSLHFKYDFGKPLFYEAKINGEEYAFGWSRKGGVLMDFGIALKNPKNKGLINFFGKWAEPTRHYKSVARIDYWGYHTEPQGYNPHYHVWDGDRHYPLQ